MKEIILKLLSLEVYEVVIAFVIISYVSGILKQLGKESYNSLRNKKK